MQLLRPRRLLLVLLAGLAMAALFPLLAPYWREQRARAIPRPVDVVLITMDTTRADSLGCYGSKTAETPVLDGLARSGVRFERAYVHAPVTAPSHASLLTGVLPTRHGMRDNGFSLPEDLPTLAESFVRAGYRTGAFVSAFVLDRRFGLARGFGSYADDVLGGGRDRVDAEVRAEITVDRALAWLASPDPRPVLAWVHLYDPHADYAPPEPFASRFRDRPYEGEIAYMDAQIGRLLAALRARGRPTLIAAIGDHGESLGAHGETTHAYFIYEETQRVPFLLTLPGYLPQGRVVRPVVRGVDLAPTLLELAGLPVPAGLDGTSLVRLVAGRERAEPGPAYLESYQPRLWWGARELLGLRTGRWLYIRSPRPELYDVELDPGARHNLAAQRPDDLVALDARLSGFVPEGDPLAGRRELDPDTAARLRALGYLGEGSPASASSPLPDAKDNGPLLAAVTEARALTSGQRPGEAIAILRAALVRHPESRALREELATTYTHAQRPAEAAEVFRGLCAEHPEEERYPLGHALAERRRGRSGEAARVLEAALALHPDSARLVEELGVVMMETGRTPEAIARLRAAVERAPRQTSPRLRLGLAFLRAGRWLEASDALREAARLSPSSTEGREAAKALALVGDRLLGMESFEQARHAYRAAIDGGVQSEAVYLNLGLACYRSERPAEALEAVRAGVERLPDSSDLHYRAGRLLSEGGETVEAEAALRKALALEPSRADARLALAALLEGSDRTAEAVEIYRGIVAAAQGRANTRRARMALARLGVKG